MLKLTLTKEKKTLNWEVLCSSLRSQAEQNLSFLFFSISLFSPNKRKTRPVRPVCAEWRLLFLRIVYRSAARPGHAETSRNDAQRAAGRQVQVKGMIMKGEQGDDLRQSYAGPRDEGQNVVRRFIMLEKLDLIIAIVKRWYEESSCSAREVIWSHFFTSMDHYFQRQFK